MVELVLDDVDLELALLTLEPITAGPGGDFGREIAPDSDDGNGDDDGGIQPADGNGDDDDPGKGGGPDDQPTGPGGDFD